MVSFGAFLPAGGDGAFHAGVFRLDEVDQIGVQIVGTRGFRVESELFIELPEHIPDDGFLVLHGEHPDAEILRFVFFPELLTAFHQDYPEIAVVLEEYGSVRACNLVQNDTLDLALVNMEQYNIDKFHNVVLANDQVVFCVNKDHRLADKEIVTTKEMSKELLIFFNADSVQNQLLKTRFEMDGYIPNIVMRSSQIYTTLQFIKTGKYSCFLYSSMLDKFTDSEITGIPLNPPIHIKIGMIWKKGKYISGDMQTFLNFTRMYYREHPLT